jgi:hypothetical protein
MQDAKHSCIAGDSRIDVLRPITYVIGWLGAGGANRTIILIGHKILSGMKVPRQPVKEWPKRVRSVLTPYWVRTTGLRGMPNRN